MFDPTTTYTAGTYSVTDGTQFLRANAVSGAITLNLPSGTRGAQFLAKKVDSSGNSVTVNAPAGKTIDGVSSFTMTVMGQCVWIRRTDTGDYDVISGGAGGSGSVNTVDYVELATDQSIGTSYAAVPTMSSITFTMNAAGKVKVGASGRLSSGGGFLWGGGLRVRVAGPSSTDDYIVSEWDYNVGSGTDKISEQSMAGSKGLFLNAGTYTITLHALSSLFTKTLVAGAMLCVDYPMISAFSGLLGANPTGPASGHLGGTYPGPTVIGMIDATFPAASKYTMPRRVVANNGWEFVEPVGVWVDDVTVNRRGGLNIKAGSGATLSYTDDPTNDRVNVTVTASGGSGADPLGKTYFTNRGIKPSGTIQEATELWPAFDFSNLNGGSATIDESRVKVGSASPMNFGWDMGSLKSKVLFITRGIRPRLTNLSMFMCDTLPAAAELPNNSYAVNLQVNVGNVEMYKRSGGTYTSIGSEAGVSAGSGVTGPSIAMAWYYDDASNTHIVYMAYGPEQWFKVLTVVDSSFTTMRYVGWRADGSVTMWLIAPMAIYAQ